MENVIKAIYTTPIIDNHAHPLLIPEAQGKYPLLAITTEAGEDAMKATKSTLSHIRAVKQLSSVLKCPETWDEVVKAIDIEKAQPNNVWEKRCLEGIECLLIDDGLDGKEEVFDYSWHDRLTRSKSYRIVRIEKVAEQIIDGCLGRNLAPDAIYSTVIQEFEHAIKHAVSDPEVVGFKSVICYRTGLDLQSPPFSQADVEPPFVELLAKQKAEGQTKFKRLDGLALNAYLVHKTANLIQSAPSKHKKPLQFHTGLGDNDITLTKSSPSHLQEFIRRYPEVPIVLLHASYPWTKEAGYLASVYANVYADIGEVFPFLSQEGQENVVREILELCPSEKLLWSTDGHWFPETYLLAVVQVREALEVVLADYVKQKALASGQAVKLIQDLFFNTSNKLYNLNLPLNPVPATNLITGIAIRAASSNFDFLTSFMTEFPLVKFLRIQYLDYTATPRLRIVPIKKALSVLQTQPNLSIGITKASLGLLQNDTIIPGVTASGEYLLEAIFSSLRPGPSIYYASVQAEFRDKVKEDGEAVLCPRSILRRTLEKAKALGLEFLFGFEIEVTFMKSSLTSPYFSTNSKSAGHAWSAARALHSNHSFLTEISDTLAYADINLEQFHPESATGQYEFVLPPLPPLEAVDTLLQAREIISTVVASHGMRATLHPKPFPMQCGTASHVHISISSANGNEKAVYEPFYAGILRSLEAIVAFNYSNSASYDRLVDGAWAGGTWIAWGTQNRETPLRKIKDSHWEIKCLDGLANAYLAMAAIIAAGSTGVEEKLTLEFKNCQKAPASLSPEEKSELGISKSLPKSLEKALDALVMDATLENALGAEVVERYIAVKEAEMELLKGMKDDERRGWIIERY